MTFDEAVEQATHGYALVRLAWCDTHRIMHTDPRLDIMPIMITDGVFTEEDASASDWQVWGRVQ